MKTNYRESRERDRLREGESVEINLNYKFDGFIVNITFA